MSTSTWGIFRTGGMIVMVCGLVARRVKRDLGDLGPWDRANGERLERCVANQLLYLVEH